MLISCPLISIITVSFNIADEIERTCKSIVNQTFQDFEWIVVDGGSDDGTKDILQRFSFRINSFTSERDNGIYNAMNKGIRKSSGKYLVFLNGGDSFFDDDSLNIISSSLTFDYDIVTGNSRIVNQLSYNDWIAPDKPDLFSSTLPHNASYIKRMLFDKYFLYNENLKIVSDYEFFIKVFFQDIDYYHVNSLVSVFYQNGISSVNRELAQKENDFVRKKYFSRRYFFQQLKLSVQHPRYLAGKIKKLFCVCA